MKLRRGQKVKFTTIDDFTGQTLQLEGVVISEAYKYIQDHRDLQKEYSGVLKNEAYIVKENSRSEKLNLHLVLSRDISKLKFKED